ncbi:MAG: hypothetical protein ACO2PN_21535 [Pyrobaculum sp.]|jgi:hypothetical protein
MDQNRQKEVEVEYLTLFALAVGIAGLALIFTHSVTTALLIIFPGFAYISFIVTVFWYFDTPKQRKEDRPMYNMKIVVSLGQRCPETATDEVARCLSERLDVKKLVVFAVLPAVTAASMALMHNDIFFFALADGLYLLSLTYAVRAAAREDSICRSGVWWAVGLALLASFLTAVAAHDHILRTHRGDPQYFLSVFNIPTFIAYLIFFARLLPKEPPLFFVKTRVQDVHTAYKRFVEDLGDMCRFGGRLPEPGRSLCCQFEEPPPQHPEYLKLMRIVRDRDVKVAEEVPVGYPLIIAAYYSIVCQKDLELAQKLMGVLRNKTLDEEEHAALQVLEVAYEAAANPPCNDWDAPRRYAERLEGIHTPGWSLLLKALTLAHLGHAEYAGIKRGILWTIYRCNGGNLSIYYFALSATDKQLCRQPTDADKPT